MTRGDGNDHWPWCITPATEAMPPEVADGSIAVVARIIAISPEAVIAVVAMPQPYAWVVPVVIPWPDVHSMHRTRDDAQQLADYIDLRMRNDDEQGAADASKPAVGTEPPT